MQKQMTLDELHQKQLDMMIAFDDFCQKHDLQYFLAYGTLIGAVRHHGFIPWDDDVDILMKREDYNKLISYSQINDTLKIVTKENSGEYYHPYTYCNVADTETIMDEHLAKKPTGKGVFLDIFPLDVLPNDYNKALRFLNKCHFFSIIQQCCLSVQNNSLKGIVKKAISVFVNWDKFYPVFQKEVQKYSKIKSKYIGMCVLVSNARNAILNTKDFETAIDVDFEGVKLKIPCGYDAILKTCYGDYMTPPDISEQQGHHMVDYYIKDFSNE